MPNGIVTFDKIFTPVLPNYDDGKPLYPQIARDLGLTYGMNYHTDLIFIPNGKTEITRRIKNIDLGYVINFEIMTKENSKIHKIKNIKIKSEFNLNKDKNFYELNKYLEILALVYREIPEWIAFEEIFDVVETINNYEKIDETKLILAKIKIKSLLWNLNIEHNDKIIEKILKFINTSKIENILKLTWINEEQKKELDLV